MDSRAIFIGSTGQNVGKTTLCLGLIAALKKRYKKVGFIKPIGQRLVAIEGGKLIDKDAVFFKHHFHLTDPWEEISPVTIPAGFTRDFLDGKTTSEILKGHIQEAFDRITSRYDFTVVEGSGHLGVGSIIGINNVTVAQKLGLDIVLIASGGVGSSHDGLSLNMALSHQHGVNVRGVILNRVLDSKREMVMEYFPKSLKGWDVPLLGCVPYSDFLSKPTIKDFEGLFQTELISGAAHRYRHFESTRLVAGSLTAFLEEIQPNELIITPASRDDIICALIEHDRLNQKIFETGMILTGRHPPSQSVLKAIKSVDIPTLYAPLCSYDAMKKITSFIAKIRLGDTLKIDRAISLVEQHIDLTGLLTPQQALFR